MGGTEVLYPIKYIYENEVSQGYLREVILITDGQIGNEAEILEFVRRGSNKTRLFTVGIGYGPNEYFIRQVARTGGGTSILIAPGERIEPIIIGLFKNIMSGRIDDLKIDWRTDVTQAPYNPVVFPGDVVSILARMGKDSKIPGQVTISAKIDSIEKKFTVKMKEIQGEDMPIPVLWAREMIRDIEEGTAGLSDIGSKQAQRKEKGIKEKIIEVSKEFGLLSRETSFVAIERREEKDKTTGEVVLRKVPVLLTKGWHGIALGNLPLFNLSLASLNRMHLSEKECLYAMAPELPLVTRHEPSQYTNQDILLKILSLQQAKGGFRVNREVAEMIGISFQDLKFNARRIEIDEEIDRFVLLSTAIILFLLKKRFVDMEDLWINVVQKSDKWFKEEIERTKPHIEGISLEQWVDNFIEIFIRDTTHI